MLHLNDFSIFPRELFEQAYRWSLCASAFASVNLKAIDHCDRRSKPERISEAQALYFFTKCLVLNPTATQLSTAVNNLESSAEQGIRVTVSSALKLLSQKGSKLGRDFSNSEEILKAARLLISGLTGSKTSIFASKVLIPASAAFARWAHRLGHRDAEQFLHEISARSMDAAYFLARILQNTSSSNVRQIEDMFKKVERSDCVSAIKAKQRLLMIKWPKPIAEIRIHVWVITKHRQRSVQSRTKSLRDFNALLCEAELKSPYSFCEQKCAVGLQIFLN